ncbi:MAG: DUF167 domain-containing protein [Planctomycetota bacterium]|nr:DUF167 domain-containing protein [Planctomycetota bacterium]
MRGAPIEPHGMGGVHVHLKVVPGATRDAIAGLYGDRIRVRVRAAPESGQANEAVLALLAKTLKVPARQVSLVRGPTTPRKTIVVRGLDAATVQHLLLDDRA